MRRRFISTLIVAASPFALGAQQVRMAPQGDGVVNDVQARMAVLVRTPLDSVRMHYTTVFVPAMSTVAANLGPTAVIERVEPVMTSAGLRTPPAVACGGQSQTTLASAIMVLQSEMAAAAVEGTTDANRTIEIATQLAQLRLERTLDSLDLKYNSMTAFTARMQAYSMGMRDTKQSQPEGNQPMETIAALAIAYSDAVDAQLSVIRQDLDRYKELSENADAAKRMTRAYIDRVTTGVEAREAYTARLISELDGAGRTGAINGRGMVRRLCTGTADLDDGLVLSFPAEATTKTLVGELSFKGAPSLHLLLRRLSGTNDWYTTFPWPARANTARLKVRAPGEPRWIDIDGSIAAGRTTLAAIEDKLNSDAGKLKKKLKEADFRATGADVVKTVITP